ncbi:MAG TPA: hypothetical protein VFO40_09605 [Chthoniobacterales bacterium]|nr:hypothetical protein [Chthoniobacterales bacterium]
MYKGFSAERFQTSPWIGTAEESEGFYVSAEYPFENTHEFLKKSKWVKPVFVCEVAFAEWTLDWELRQTTFSWVAQR